MARFITSFEFDLPEDQKSTVAATNNTDHGWQKVTYAKRQRKLKHISPNSNGGIGDNGKPDVFSSLEQQSEARRRKILEAQSQAATVALDVAPRSRRWADEVEDGSNSDNGDDVVDNGKKAEPKPKKPKKHKVTVAEAAAKIDAADLAAFLLDISGSYEGQQEIQLMRFADYFGRAFSQVSASQFPWMKIFRESTIAKIIDIPVSQISDDVYKTSVDWISKHSLEALGSCVLWSLDSILADLASHQAAAKGSKKGSQQISSKSQVAMFVVSAMVLRRKPDVLINLLPAVRENPKYQGQDKLPVVVWIIAQACQGDLAVGLHAWAHHLLPLVGSKNCNPQSRDLVLQLVERILSAPKARTILVSGAVRKGERLMPPSALETMMRVTFPASSARVKATERFEVIYPTLKEVALAGSPGSKAMKQVSLQILSFALKAAGESIHELSNEAAAIFIWCLTQNSESYKKWDKVYMENLEASVVILKKINAEWKEHSAKLSPFEPLSDALKNFKRKNEEALTDGADATHHSLIKDADKYSKAILRRTARGHGCLKSLTIIIFLAGVGAALISPKVESWDLKELSMAFNSLLE